jgi:hypothetical protein
MVTVAIVAIALGLGMPSLREWMVAQRVSAVATELTTDFRYARSEALSQNGEVGIAFSNAGNGCYTIYRRVKRVNPGDCDCTKPAGSVCKPVVAIELKTLVLPVGGDVSIYLSGTTLESKLKAGASLDEEATNGLDVEVRGGGTRELRVRTTRSFHHARVCKPAGSTISGFKSCT